MQRKSKTARVRTEGLLKKTAKVGTVVLLKQTARERTRESLENLWKGGEFIKSERKRSARKRRKIKKKKVKYRRCSWWKKCKERIARFLTARRKEEEKEKEGRKRDRRPRARQVLEKSGRWLFLLVLLGQSGLSVNAAEKDGDDGKVAAAGSSREQLGGGDFTKG